MHRRKRMLLSEDDCIAIAIAMMMLVNAVYYFLGLVCYLFTHPDVKIFLSRKICQDLLEKFFGRQCQHTMT